MKQRLPPYLKKSDLDANDIKCRSNMPLNREDINQLAHLCRLEVDDFAATNLAQDLQRMMQLVAKIQEASTSNLNGTVHMRTDYQPLREDQAIPPSSNLTTGAAATEKDFVVIPKVI